MTKTTTKAAPKLANDRRYMLHSIADFPFANTEVRVEVDRGNHVRRPAVLIGAGGKVFRATRGDRTVLDEPALFGLFSKLTGIRVAELRELRKKHLAQEEAERRSEDYDYARRLAGKLGYRLVKES